MRRFLAPPATPMLFALAAALTASLTACAPEPHPMNVVEATIAQVQDAILSGRTTCRMVVQAYLDRIAGLRRPTVNAITVVNPKALTRAD